MPGIIRAGRLSEGNFARSPSPSVSQFNKLSYIAAIMRVSHLSLVILFASSSLAAPHGKRQSGLSPDGNYFPLQNGFPNPNRDGEITIQDGAHGTLPNGPPPPALSAEGVTNLKLIALNELFEVAFFTELIYNVTNKVSGYDLGMGHDYMLDSLNAIVNQEELHVLNANGALDHFKQEKIQPCKYNCKPCSTPIADSSNANNA